MRLFCFAAAAVVPTLAATAANVDWAGGNGNFLDPARWTAGALVVRVANLAQTLFFVK